MSRVLQRIECLHGDITQQHVDAIVNAANTSLRGGAGVDGAIHRAAGPGLLAECIERHPEGCPTGEARITAGHGLIARHVIHTPGPIWHGGAHGEADALASCHHAALALAAQYDLATLAFPAISTGVYGYPVEQAAAVAMGAVASRLAQLRFPDRVRFVLFSEDSLAVYEAARRHLAGH